ncbi:protein of unknown function [Pseudonocardia thermophila]|jgi:hypothetical protein|uniref:DUF4349 domain-containing protein n=1 Tax=Pseudonocardia thermophila TaxID=1848 RepID=A0A1M6YBQ5_PSETH|nr:DUF4349 domain-containing protein [Pseudonocardia thermophila]SHL15523.1 protein of unknown function [Pseudonocardia thermophila]
MAQQSGRRIRLIAAVGAALIVLTAGVSCSAAENASPGAAGERGVAAAPGQDRALDSAHGSATAELAPGGAPGRGGSPEVPAQQLDVERSVVRTAALTVDTADVAAAVRQVRSIAVTAQGIVAEERQTGGSGASLTLRIPADSLDRVIDDVAALGKVTDRRSQATDVTDQMIDLDSRVASQQASVERIRALLARAESIADITRIESELAQREAELDSLKNRLAALRGKVALSTLTVDLVGTGAAPLPPASDTPGFLQGLAAGWETLVRIAIVVGAVIGFLIPYLPVAAVIVGIAWFVRRTLRRRAPAVAGAAVGQGGPGAEGE